MSGEILNLQSLYDALGQFTKSNICVGCNNCNNTNEICTMVIDLKMKVNQRIKEIRDVR